MSGIGTEEPIDVTQGWSACWGEADAPRPRPLPRGLTERGEHLAILILILVVGLDNEDDIPSDVEPVTAPTDTARSR